MSNGTLVAFAKLAEVYTEIGIGSEVTTGHDGQFIKPDSLRKLADRIEMLNLFPEQLRWLADEGGAIVG